VISIETRAFTKLLPNYLSDDEYRGIQAYLLQKPGAGDIVRGSGGARKVRWSRDGEGKSGGIRVIYYWKNLNPKYGCSLFSQNLREPQSRALI
jgi:hypothetical protein